MTYIVCSNMTCQVKLNEHLKLNILKKHVRILKIMASLVCATPKKKRRSLEDLLKLFLKLKMFEISDVLVHSYYFFNILNVETISVFPFEKEYIENKIKRVYDQL